MHEIGRCDFDKEANNLKPKLPVPRLNVALPLSEREKKNQAEKRVGGAMRPKPMIDPSQGPRTLGPRTVHDGPSLLKKYLFHALSFTSQPGAFFTEHFFLLFLFF